MEGLTSMLSDFVTAICDLKERERVQVKTYDWDHETAYVEGPTGIVDRLERQEPPRSISCFEIDGLAKILADLTVAPNTEVYVSPTGVSGFLDSSNRRGKVSLPLAWSPEFERIVAMRGGGQPMKPPEVVSFLKWKLWQLEAPLLDVFGTLSFRQGQQGSFVAVHGRDSMGASVNAEVDDAAKIPKVTTVHVPVYSVTGGNLKKPVTLGIHVDAKDQTITLYPEPRSVHDAIESAVGDVFALLKSKVTAGAVHLGAIASR